MSAQNCTKPFLHKGTKLHEDKIARRVTFAQTDNFARVEFFFTITVTTNPYPRSLRYFFFINFIFCFIVTFTSYFLIFDFTITATPNLYPGQ